MIDVTVIVPVLTLHEGCVMVAVGAEGGVGWVFMVAAVTDDIQPVELLLAVTL